MRSYLQLIELVPQGPRNDVTPLFADFAAFSALVDDLAQPFSDAAVDYVAGIDALGFILGTAIALRLRKGFIPIRKGGKLPVPVTTAEFVDYTGERVSLELRTGIMQPGHRVLLVDEWVETGAQVRAAVQLIEQQGGVVMGITAIHMDDSPVTKRLRKGFKCHDMSLEEWEPPDGGITTPASSPVAHDPPGTRVP
jgi:adenine phosphoribosyltransferase